MFFAVPNPFLNETAFNAKLARRFQVLKPKSRDLLPPNLVQTYNLLVLNSCQNFMELHQTFLSYKRKSETSQSLWPRKNKETRDASVGRSNDLDALFLIGWIFYFVLFWSKNFIFDKIGSIFMIFRSIKHLPIYYSKTVGHRNGKLKF